MRLLPAILWLLLGGCRATPSSPPPARVEFLRGAVLGPPSLGGVPVGGGRHLRAQAWSPGETLTWGDLSARAPARPSCLPLFHHDLGDVTPFVALGGSEPGTALAFSPDGASLAVGSHRGEVLILDAFTGEVRVRRALAESLLRTVAWSADGTTVYAGEQSPDGLLHALDPATLASRFTLRAADELGTSPPPAKTEIYGIYTLPGIYTILPLRDGGLLAAGSHSWTDAAGVRRNQSRLWRLDPTGAVRARFPADAPAEATLIFPRIDDAQRRLVVPVLRSADAPPTADLPAGALIVLDLTTLTVQTTIVTPPLAPHFAFAFPWQAVDLDDTAVFVGFSDGRAQLVPLGGGPRVELTPGTPILAADVPISASIGWGALDRGRLIFSTGETNIPWGADTTATSPPSAHPGQNTVWMHDRAGTPLFAFRSEESVQGLSFSPDGRLLVVGAGRRSGDTRRDLFGALVLDVSADLQASERLLARCPTDGPVHFEHAVTDDGRIAVAEAPILGADGAVTGSYRVTVLR